MSREIDLDRLASRRWKKNESIRESKVNATKTIYDRQSF